MGTMNNPVRLKTTDSVEQRINAKLGSRLSETDSLVSDMEDIDAPRKQLENKDSK